MKNKSPLGTFHDFLDPKLISMRFYKLKKGLIRLTLSLTNQFFSSRLGKGWDDSVVCYNIALQHLGQLQ